MWPWLDIIYVKNLGVSCLYMHNSLFSFPKCLVVSSIFQGYHENPHAASFASIGSSVSDLAHFSSDNVTIPSMERVTRVAHSDDVYSDFSRGKKRRICVDKRRA